MPKAKAKKPRGKRRKSAGPGRPTRYSVGMAARALELCKGHGYDEVRLAKALGVPRTTLRDWRKKHKPLDDAIKTGVELHDVATGAEMEKALVNKGLGKVKIVTKTVETAPITCKDGPCYGPDGELLLGTTTRTVTAGQAPDVAAIKYFLNNRAPGRWAEKPAAEGGPDDSVTFTMHLHAPEPRQVAANG